MEMVIVLIIVAVVAYFAYKAMIGAKSAQEVISDINNNVVTTVKKTADVNKDGKVNGADVDVVVKEVKNTTEKVAARVKKVINKTKAKINE